MSRIERDHQQLQRLFAGDLGDCAQLYGNMTVSGDALPPSGVQAVLGLYSVAPPLRFFRLLPETAATYEWMLPRIQAFALNEEALRRQYELIATTHPDWQQYYVGDKLWRDTQKKLVGKGLPICFFSCQGLEGDTSVAFWYPRFIIAEGMLSAFKVITSQIRHA